MAAWYDQGQNAEMEDAQPPQDDEPDDNEEQSILEFARFHMLSIDYASESPFAGALSEPDGSGVHEIWTDLPDNATSQDVFEDLTKERLGISPKALELLKQSCRIPAEYPIICPPSPPRASQLKEELPLLPSDNEYDLKHFGRRVTRDFRRVNLPPEPVDEEKDEGLSWPTRYYALPAECDAKARHEKLEIPRDVMHFLQEAIRNPMTTSESEQVLDIELPTKKVIKASRLSRIIECC